MLRSMLLAAMLSACGSCGSSPLHADLPSGLPVPTAQKLTITSHEVDGGSSICTAFKLSDSLVGTAGHCCEDGEADTYSIGSTGIEARVLHHTLKPDICVLAGHMDGPSIAVAPHDPAVGQSVYVYGFPHGTPSFQTAYWAGRDDEHHGIVSIDAAGGYSGSPVLNGDGELVGILVSGYLGQSVTFLTPVESIRSAINIVRHLGPKE